MSPSIHRFQPVTNEDRSLPRSSSSARVPDKTSLEPSSQSRVEGGEFNQPRRVIMAEKDLNALFLDTLKDIYYAEKQIYRALPKMAKAANSDQLRAAFEKHHDETEGQIERLEQIFELLGKPARGKKCDAIEGILDEGTEIMDEYKGEPALDAGLLAAAQAVEHYEISRYGTLKTWAGKLQMKDAVKLLDATLAEEKKTDDALTKLADTAVNAEAM
jgi:ferritin-like metal-binding protein YciE